MIIAEIAYKARIEFDSTSVKVRGSKTLLDKIADIKSQHGNDPKNWPEQIVVTGEDVLINEFILKVKSKFKFCYNHEELCHCRNIATEKVFTSIKNGCFKVEEVSRATLAGTGCGSCRKDITDLIKQFKIS